MQEALEEAYVRFLYNLPLEEQEPERLMVNMEQAHWLYEDELVNNIDIPSLKFHKFVKYMKDTFNILPNYSTKELIDIYEDYKAQIPVRGGILLNSQMDKALLVTNYNCRVFGFPKGKINEEESDEACALREVKEEVGYDASHLLNPSDYLELPGGHIKLYIFPNVPETYKFETNTKGEIGLIEWIKLDDIPSKKNKNTNLYRSYKFGKVHEFLPDLRKWIKNKKSEEVVEVKEESLKVDFKFNCSSLSDFKFKIYRLQSLLDYYIPPMS